MLYRYQAIEKTGREVNGTVDALNEDVAINSLQRRGLIVSSIKEEGGDKPLFQRELSLFQGISNKDVVILSRQIATLFDSQVSALRIFRMLATESDNPKLGRKLAQVTDDLQGGSAISVALSKHPEVFSGFYVNMVRSGEESGRLSEVFLYLADYLDRNYEITSKARNALIYPAFVIFTFFAVMILMLTVVIPKISTILRDSGQAIPLYTKVVLAISDFAQDYGLVFAGFLVVGGVFLVRYFMTEHGKVALDSIKISTPYIGDLFRKLYIARIMDNLSTMLGSGIAIVRAIEITADVVDNAVYKDLLLQAGEKVKNGSTLSDAFPRVPEIPGIVIQMARIGEEAGELDKIMKTLAKFYNREVTNAVDTLVDLIEPVMIVLLGLGVGILLASVLIPIYNVTANI